MCYQEKRKIYLESLRFREQSRGREQRKRSQFGRCFQETLSKNKSGSAISDSGPENHRGKGIMNFLFENVFECTVKNVPTFDTKIGCRQLRARSPLKGSRREDTTSGEQHSTSSGRRSTCCADTTRGRHCAVSTGPLPPLCPASSTAGLASL